LKEKGHKQGGDKIPEWEWRGHKCEVKYQRMTNIHVYYKCWDKKMPRTRSVCKNLAVVASHNNTKELVVRGNGGKRSGVKTGQGAGRYRTYCLTNYTTRHQGREQRHKRKRLRQGKNTNLGFYISNRGKTPTRRK